MGLSHPFTRVTTKVSTQVFYVMEDDGGSDEEVFRRPTGATAPHKLCALNEAAAAAAAFQLGK